MFCLGPTSSVANGNLRASNRRGPRTEKHFPRAIFPNASLTNYRDPPRYSPRAAPPHQKARSKDFAAKIGVNDIPSREGRRVGGFARPLFSWSSSLAAVATIYDPKLYPARPEPRGAHYGPCGARATHLEEMTGTAIHGVYAWRGSCRWA
jgi:hypothetical protein